ncbi:MAG TPA: hypothetical protein VGY56_13500 [Verrucomicrobiae bacterium]|nr:hypothetical protein [Verrucomicrobiae bacterium]
MKTNWKNERKLLAVTVVAFAAFCNLTARAADTAAPTNAADEVLAEA